MIADVESTPTWSPQYQSAEVLDTYDDGRPRQVKMTIKAAGLTDEQVVEYTWGDNEVSWTLVSAGQLKSQDAKYTLTPQGTRPGCASTWRSTWRSNCPASWSSGP